MIDEDSNVVQFLCPTSTWAHELLPNGPYTWY